MLLKIFFVMTVCTYWSQVLAHRPAPDERQATISAGFDACFLSVALKLTFAWSFYATNCLPFTRVKWNLHWVRTSVLSCKGVTTGNMFSVLFTNPSWFTWRFLQMPMRGVEEVLCALAGGPVLQNYQPELSHLLQGWQHQTEHSGGDMNFSSCKLMALQQPSKSAFLQTLLFVSCTYFWSWQQ